MSLLAAEAASPVQKALGYIVDDDADLGCLVQTILEQAGLRTVFFPEPDQALKAFQAAGTKPDLLLTDFHMHSMDGMELIESCKRLEPRLKTILYSGTVLAEMLEPYAYKPDKFLQKPFQPKLLLDAIRAALAS